ncbi:MAG: DUF924 family protein [Pseudomonadota bacterium]
MKDPIEQLHNFWFGALDDIGMPIEDRNELWFGAQQQTDDACRHRFSGLLVKALAGELEHWHDTDRGLIALIVLLDQISRNVHRGDAGAFAGDARALSHSLRAINDQRHPRLPACHQVFLYLPLEHSEVLAHQNESVRLFDALATSRNSEAMQQFARYAHAHRDVIRRFGRFPHRNRVLGRKSSAEELDYLERHGGF